MGLNQFKSSPPNILVQTVHTTACQESNLSEIHFIYTKNEQNMGVLTSEYAGGIKLLTPI